MGCKGKKIKGWKTENGKRKPIFDKEEKKDKKDAEK